MRPLARTAVLAAAVATCLSAGPRGARGKEATLPPKPAIDKGTSVEVGAGPGAALLLAVPSGMVRYAAATSKMGSDADLFWAKAQCQAEPLGFLCEAEDCRLGKADPKSACISPVFLHETPEREVTLKAFDLDRTEVTVGAYRRCVLAGGCSPATFPPGDPRFDRDDLPVTHVSWHDAVRYCTFRGARLPTEAEWERAARGLAGRRYPWGKLPNPKIANHGSLDWGSLFLHSLDEWIVGVPDPVDGALYLAPVGSYPEGVNPEGVHDLAGNVAEWVADWWEDVYGLHQMKKPDSDTIDPKSPLIPRKVTDPTGPPTGVFRVLRGGSYKQPMVSLRGASRTRLPPGAREPDLGFRCAKDP